MWIIMGDPKRLNRLYDVPRMKWNKQRILADRKIMDEYGLRTKKELWKAETTVRELRKRARLLLAGRSDNYEVRKNELLGKLIALGIFTKDHKIEDVLKLTLTDFLDRRLQTIVLRKGLALTPLQSRQLIVHGHIAVNGRKRNIPGSIVRADEVIAYTKTHIKNVIDKSIEMKGKPISKEVKKDKQAPAKIENNEENTEWWNMAGDKIGIVNIFASRNNTIVVLTDETGAEVIAKSSGGQLTKSQHKEGSPYIAMKIGQIIAEKARDKGIGEVHVKIRAPGGNLYNNPGQGAEPALKSLTRYGLRILSIQNTTPIPHDGCRKKKGYRTKN